MPRISQEIVLPALRGVMGNWVYYSCLMTIDELSRRVTFAGELHNNQALSGMIQRQLKINRGAQIAEYLQTQQDRFFNSLVVATYGGQPNWHAISEIRATSRQSELKDLPEETIESVGFMTLRGDEKLFALDGQHRLAGIQKAVREGVEDDPYDVVSVIFVEHRKDRKGLERTRRLFTTLNKTAKPVSKGDIIALDEDDVMAICVRRLIEETELFAGNRIAFVATNNMPTRNVESLTTIGNLYDILTIMFTTAESELKRKKANLQRIRPSDAELDKYLDYAVELFELFRSNFAELGEYFAAHDTEPVVREYRGAHGGSCLFRPIGLDLFARVVSRLTKDMSLSEAVRCAARLPTNLNEKPFDGLAWDTAKKTIMNGHKVTLREILLYMLGMNSKSFPEEKLLERYRLETGNDTAELPETLV